jgi:hypothetical protein
VCPYHTPRRAYLPALRRLTKSTTVCSCAALPFANLHIRKYISRNQSPLKGPSCSPHHEGAGPPSTQGEAGGGGEGLYPGEGDNVCYDGGLALLCTSDSEQTAVWPSAGRYPSPLLTGDTALTTASIRPFKGASENSSSRALVSEPMATIEKSRNKIQMSLESWNKMAKAGCLNAFIRNPDPTKGVGDYVQGLHNNSMLCTIPLSASAADADLFAQQMVEVTWYYWDKGASRSCSTIQLS